MNNEVVDIEVVLIEIATVFKERANSVPEEQQQALPQLLIVVVVVVVDS